LSGVPAFRGRHIDTVILDIGVTREDALITLNRLLRIDSHAKVVMASTLSFAIVRKSMMGFERGAADFVQMPAEYTSQPDVDAFGIELRRLIAALTAARRREAPRGAPAVKPREARTRIVLRAASPHRPRVLAIGSSTGGPEALHTVIDRLPDYFPLPILITQHMPKVFTAVLANTLSKRTGKNAVEATRGMIVEPGTIYIAPGDYHMTIVGTPARSAIALEQTPPVNYCRPSVDPMLESIVKIYGANTLALILTGMGADGKKGAALVVENGGSVIAQDSATSVVWGMPGAVAEAGLCCRVLPLDRIATAIRHLVGG
jgi:two-component system chemotaxis response regulator CheB